MFWLKRCPKCGGDLIDESDVYGTCITCLQCGQMLTDQEEEALKRSGTGSDKQIRGGRGIGAA